MVRFVAELIRADPAFRPPQAQRGRQMVVVKGAWLLVAEHNGHPSSPDARLERRQVNRAGQHSILGL